ncbi:MAG TPA: response regulator [Gemmatimonadales bacterium]
MDLIGWLIAGAAGALVGATGFAMLRMRARRRDGVLAPLADPELGGGRGDSKVTRELIAAWVQFLRSEAADTANALNNRLNAIARLLAGLDDSTMSSDDRARLAQIATDVQRAGTLTAGLLNRVDPIAPGSVPAPYLTLRDEPIRPAKILIVEDDQRNREVICQLLAEIGHIVTPARDGIEGFAALEADHFDCVLCDIRMAGLGGKSLYEQVEEKMPNLASRFVFVTGDYNRPETREFLARAGCPVVTKPYQVSELLSAIAVTLRRVGVILDAETDHPDEGME